MNLLMSTDSYKHSHMPLYPKNTQKIFSYGESRGGGEYTTYAGMWGFISKYLSRPITMADINEAESYCKTHGTPFYREGWEYVLSEYNGYMPVVIHSVKEGSIIPTKNCLYTIVNTDDKCAFVTSFLETAMLRAIWYPTSVATISTNIKSVIRHYLEMNGTPEEIDYKLHSFGARGVSSGESCAIGDAANLIVFKGTDCLESIRYLDKVYSEPMAGGSIPASEHSTITSWGAEFELDAYRNMIEVYAKPNALFACVSDSYDIFGAIDMWKSLEPLLLEKGGRLIIRPDSGDPVSVSCEVVRRCLKVFGYTLNKKKFMVLPDHIRVIQGDGINQESITQILETLHNEGISADNIAFGMGGAMLQHTDRDQFRFAMKCSAAMVDGKWIDVYKSPITDSGKKSKRGRIGTFIENGAYSTRRINDKYDIGEWTDYPAQLAMSCVYAHNKETIRMMGKPLCVPEKFTNVREHFESEFKQRVQYNVK